MPDLSLVCIVKDADGNLLDGVNIAMTNVSNNKNENVYTQANGQYRKPLIGFKMNDILNYRFVAHKDQYLEATKSYQTTINKEGEYVVEITMLKLKVGSKLSDFIEIKPILFDFNKFNIRPDAATELEKIIKVMNEHPTMVIELGSHTDCRGSIKSNTRLSDRRAKASAKYIKSKITKPERIYGKGYGETQLKIHCKCNNKPVKHNLTDAQHQANRRTEFKIISM